MTCVNTVGGLTSLSTQANSNAFSLTSLKSPHILSAVWLAGRAEKETRLYLLLLLSLPHDTHTVSKHAKH